VEFLATGLPAAEQAEFLGKISSLSQEELLSRGSFAIFQLLATNDRFFRHWVELGFGIELAHLFAVDPADSPGESAKRFLDFLVVVGTRIGSQKK
jgi:hypothetical protein